MKISDRPPADGRANWCAYAATTDSSQSVSTEPSFAPRSTQPRSTQRATGSPAIHIRIQDFLRSALTRGAVAAMLGAGLLAGPALATPATDVPSTFPRFAQCAPEYDESRAQAGDIEQTPLFDLYWRHVGGMARCGID